jgi:hypothetical protein
MRDQQAPRTLRRGSQLLSTVLFVAAIAFAVLAVVIWFRDDAGPNREPPIPTATAGRYDLANVFGALEATGLDGDFGRTPATANSNQIDTPGQHLKVNGQSLYVFIFPGADAESATAARETAGTDLDAATMTLTAPQSGTDVTGGEELTVLQGANVIAVLVGGDAELQEEVTTVIEGLD